METLKEERNIEILMQGRLLKLKQNKTKNLKYWKDSERTPFMPVNIKAALGSLQSPG